MKVENSKYLESVKAKLREMLDLLLKEYEYASILAVDSVSKRYSVSKSGVVLGEDGMLTQRGVVVKVYNGKNYSEYSFNKIDDEEISHALKEIRNNLTVTDCALPEGVTLSEYKKMNDEACVFNESTEYEKDAADYGEEKIIEKLTQISQAGLALDERIINCSASVSYQKYSKLFLSPNRDMTQNVMWTAGSVMVASGNGSKVEPAFKSFSKLGGIEIIDNMEKELGNIAKISLELLDSEPITPGEYDCICTPEVTGMIVHEAFGHGVEMDMFVKKRALAEKYVGKYVASELVTMHDGAAVGNEVASYFFDDEGVMAKDTIVIEKGILKSGISDSLTALALGTEPTGNGRRESYKRKAYTRMTNTFFEAGKDKLEDMIASIKYGFMLENASSGMEDPKNWGIQCMVSVAREIKDGKFTGKIYSPIVLTGYVPDLLKSISMVSDKCELSGGGFCGKGYKEWVKVSDGGPYIKARIRLG